MSDRAVRARRLALAAWAALAASVAAWPFARAGIGPVTTAIAFIPLLFPLPGIAGGRVKTQRAAPMALAPALALALAEVVVNADARLVAGLSVALVVLAFAALLAALRTAPPA
jgi:uncharacterized membrane protein